MTVLRKSLTPADPEFNYQGNLLMLTADAPLLTMELAKGYLNPSSLFTRIIGIGITLGSSRALSGFLVITWLFAPFLFNPSGFEWQKIVDDWDDFFSFF